MEVAAAAGGAPPRAGGLMPWMVPGANPAWHEAAQPSHRRRLHLQRGRVARLAAAGVRIQQRSIAMTRSGRRAPAQPVARYEQVYAVDTLTRAWQQVRRSGVPGVDGESATAFAARWPEHMAMLAAELREGRYQPQPLRRFLLAKPDGGTHTVALLTLRDRIVQRAVLDVVQPVYTAAAPAAAFGALPGRGVEAALARAEAAR